jgi:pyruvate/2-oxoglutarate dehydrogenase complex dihydrolipoamide acyltransferase (E2) component
MPSPGVRMHAGCFCLNSPTGILLKISQNLAWYLLTLVAVPLTPAMAQKPQSPATAASAPVAPAAQQAAPQTTAQAAASGRPHPVTLAAAQQGVLSCSARINQVVTALGVTESAGGTWLLPSEQQDQRLAPLALEVPTTLAGSAYISATFAPNQANGCGASYDAVFYWPQSCDEVTKQSFVGLKSLGRMKKDIAVLDGGANIKIFLMPAGTSGCISIKRVVS